MRTISAVQAQVGDVVAEPVVNDHGRTLLPKGARLSPAVLSRLEGWGVAELCIEAEEEAPAASDEDATADEADLLAALDHRFSGWEEDAYDDAHQGYRSPPLGIVASRLRRHFRGQRQARPRTAKGTRTGADRTVRQPAYITGGCCQDCRDGRRRTHHGASAWGGNRQGPGRLGESAQACQLRILWFSPDPIADHHDFRPQGDHAQRTAAVHLADILVRAEGFGSGGDRRIPQLATGTLDTLGFDLDTIQGLMDRIHGDLRDVAARVSGLRSLPLAAALVDDGLQVLDDHRAGGAC